MRFRQFRKRDTQQWLNALFTVDGASFSVPESSHRDAIAGFLGLTPAELETVESDRDERSGTLLTLPTPAPAANPRQVRLDRIGVIDAIPRFDWTTAQMRELIDLVAQEVTS